MCRCWLSCQATVSAQCRKPMVKPRRGVLAPSRTSSARRWLSTTSRKCLILPLELRSFAVVLRNMGNGGVADRLPETATLREMALWLRLTVLRLRMPSLRVIRGLGNRHFVVGPEGAGLTVPILPFLRLIELYCHGALQRMQWCLSMQLKHHGMHRFTSTK